MAAPGHKFVAVTGVDPSGGGTVPDVFAVADDGTIANLSGAWSRMLRRIHCKPSGRSECHPLRVQ